ncbi:hypothetical protein PIB30_058012 [Stylosanthes scabra]|uniref:Uncharacterized protein n=1 Tax=Stylosanthes scabra TaxID=79078 RepID=A0ABU6QJG2_9FABA|nr:hypothetical protein [Stylosanthes scabra]
MDSSPTFRRNPSLESCQVGYYSDGSSDAHKFPSSPLSALKVTFGPSSKLGPNVTSTLYPKAHGSAELFQLSGKKDKQILNFDPEIEKTLRKLRKQSKLLQQTHENPSKEVLEKGCDNMAEARNQRRTLANFTNPTTASYGSSIVWPTVEANNFELKPALVQLVQQN